MSSLPDIEETDGLMKARHELTALRGGLLGGGLDPESFSEIVEAVRALDAEIVAAVHQSRIQEFYPYYPESFQAEEDGYEAAEKWLRCKLPKEWNL